MLKSEQAVLADRAFQKLAAGFRRRKARRQAALVRKTEAGKQLNDDEKDWLIFYGDMQVAERLAA